MTDAHRSSWSNPTDKINKNFSFHSWKDKPQKEAAAGKGASTNQVWMITNALNNFQVFICKTFKKHYLLFSFCLTIRHLFLLISQKLRFVAVTWPNVLSGMNTFTKHFTHTKLLMRCNTDAKVRDKQYLTSRLLHALSHFLLKRSLVGSKTSGPPKAFMWRSSNKSIRAN